jgi:hypothetical protein
MDRDYNHAVSSASALWTASQPIGRLKGRVLEKKGGEKTLILLDVIA